MPFPEFPVALGVLYRNPRPAYDEILVEQRDKVTARAGKGDLQALLRSGETWTV